ncbi:hypothetical protein Kpol_322p7 [Vanderwaltozyma polyspora DSM 70294]|uniref:Uncharacterized protein n=1 Tax=Vanderwaltozyma polyspora (strain ATCC 22028 / DSM 70294 / BCRC 21397 / CBS 2163 / NBRC 10782 / NRRL Y-8283 / UCD 57-17) TaxID=436907 RepID=A7TSY1_VANPO|nr:uncharacterized protein Kpol_322p7 [Vanderwaltozyma polyspora DSM 70294]EDO14630.1 hypothetical protein Kpol_322p7 [Vanderwaltozyma polyspora DSM 70294]
MSEFHSVASTADLSKYMYGVPKEEESILKYLLDVRAQLAKLKTNRSQFLNSKEVQNLHQEVLTKVRELDDIRKRQAGEDAVYSKTMIHNEALHNKVDSLLDDVFQLLSLCFLTVGLKNSAPATYSSLSTVQKLLEHLDESNIFTNHDLRPIKDRLDEISTIVENNSYRNYDFDLTNPADETEEKRNKNKIEEDLLLRAKLKHCLDEYNKIHSKLEEISPELSSIMEKLYHIRRSLLSLASPSRKIDTREDFSQFNSSKESQEALSSLEQELEELESHRDENGNFKSLETGEVVLKGQNVLAGLVDNCHDLINDFNNSGNGSDLVDPELEPIYDELINIKTNLANLMITRRWTLRDTDLFQYQKKLQAIDNKRVNGKFPTKSGDTKGQAILLYLLRRCYAIIYKLLESSVPVSESLQSIHNQLSTARRCLLSLKRMGGVNSERELYPYQLKLASLDELRIDGKFFDANGEIPEGQGTLNALLAECFDIMHELEIEAEERADNEEEEESENPQPIARTFGDNGDYEVDYDNFEEEE